jgi:hypothetical protein
VLEPDEECDGGAGCTDCELDGFACNPLNDAGCGDGETCAYTRRGTFECQVAAGEGAPGAACTNLYTGFQCATGLGCEATCGGFCCTPYCDTTGTFASCDQGSCESFWLQPEQNAGLHWLGSCQG